MGYARFSNLTYDLYKETGNFRLNRMPANH